MRVKYIIGDEQKRLIERVINDGDRAEVVPLKNGVKILRCQRHEEKSKLPPKMKKHE